jgi:hypothetical protein
LEGSARPGDTLVAISLGLSRRSAPVACRE